MMAAKPLLRILLVEDNEDDALILLREIQKGGYSVDCERVETVEAMKSALDEEAWDLIISDYSLPHFSAPEALAMMKENEADLPFLIISGTTTEENAVAALKAGAHDFIIKGRLARLIPAIQRELKEALERRERKQRERELEAIASVSMALRTAKTLDEIISHLLNIAVELISADAGSIWLYDASSKKVNLRAWRGWKNVSQAASSVNYGEDVPGLVISTGEAIISREFHYDPRVAEENRGLIPEGIGGACIPLQSDEDVMGAMFVNVTLPREITSGELRVLKALADIGGNTLNRMHLHEQTVRQLERLDALHAIDLLISNTLDLNVTLDILVNHVSKLLEVDAVIILLLKPDTQRLEYAAGTGFKSPLIKTANVQIGEGFAGQIVLERRMVRLDHVSEEENPVFSTIIRNEKFATYIGVPLSSKGRIIGVLEILHRSSLTPSPDWLSFLETLGGQAAIAIENSTLFQKLQRSNFDLEIAYEATIEGWSHALDLRDKETEGHTRRVTNMTLKLARSMGFTDQQLTHIRRGALLHDIGKMGVPDRILLKPDKLTAEEWEVMYQHPQLAHEWLAPITYLQPALDIPYCHHEKWDGTGYPRGLKGREIPMAARIFAIVDVWDALTNERPYRPAWPVMKAIEFIKQNSGIHFDPQVAELFLKDIADEKS
jgi:putative nucleotidyltransferase with HDIG domain